MNENNNNNYSINKNDIRKLIKKNNNAHNNKNDSNVNYNKTNVLINDNEKVILKIFLKDIKVIITIIIKI